MLWERQPKESDEAWEAFQIYLSLGAERSIPKVVQKCTKNKSLIKRWSSKYQWVERVRTRDNWLMSEEDKAQRNEVRRRTINRGKLYDNVFDAQAKYISYLTSKDPATLTVREAEYLMKNGDTLYRDHRDMFMLTAAEQARDDIENARIDLEYDKLEVTQPTATAEATDSNFIEALNADADKFFPDAHNMLQSTKRCDIDDDKHDEPTKH